MNVFFDVDFTLIGWDRTLRAHTHEVFEQLIADGHTVYIWSGVGDRTAEMQQHGLDHLVAGIFTKPLSNFDEGLATHGIPVVPDFVVDDHPGIVQHFGGLLIAPYLNHFHPDDHLTGVPEMVAALATKAG